MQTLAGHVEEATLFFVFFDGDDDEKYCYDKPAYVVDATPPRNAEKTLLQMANVMSARSICRPVRARARVFACASGCSCGLSLWWHVQVHFSVRGEDSRGRYHGFCLTKRKTLIKGIKVVDSQKKCECGLTVRNKKCITNYFHFKYIYR